ncbi:BolA family protein [Tepidiphilus succinatimandens]|jgi:BolA protein|uniref:BolA family protein n=1 Tax=Tepidiphilus succinatimandens TaxID=224436 RepID=UPI00112F7125|nr:BolA family protein [Tepidiphilus succinatimandens]
MPEYDPIAELRRRLQTLEPLELEIRDDSAAHAGHAGAAGGGHYRVRLVSPRFAGLSRVQRHRLVFAAAGDLMQKGIHALAVTALAPGE